MGLKSGLEPLYDGLDEHIINVGSFEKDGSYPYMYNNNGESIHIVKYDEDMVATIDSVIENYKTVSYRNNNYVLPLLANSLDYIRLDESLKASNECSALFAFPLYKTIVKEANENGMMLFGSIYEQDPTNAYDFKTIGVYYRRTIDGSTGVAKHSFRVASYQYGKTDDDITMTELATGTEHHIEYSYTLDMLTIRIGFKYDTDTTITLNCIEVDESNDSPARYIDFSTTLLKADTSFEPSDIDRMSTLNELEKKMEYSIGHIKTFSSELDNSTLYTQSKILVLK